MMRTGQNEGSYDKRTNRLPFPNISFIKLYMCPRNMETVSMPAFMPLSRNFKVRSISTIRRAGGNGPMLQDDSLTISIIAICVHPNPVVGFDHL
jgi:hypothetical protein